MKINGINAKESKFKPVTLEITFEREEELVEFYLRMSLIGERIKTFYDNLREEGKSKPIIGLPEKFNNCKDIKAWAIKEYSEHLKRLNESPIRGE
jgi:hypothetical protein